MPIISSAFSSTGLFSHPHLQTILASKWYKPDPPVTQRERLELDDGDFIDIAWGGEESSDLVLLFHGLAGGLDSPYIQGVMNTLPALGFRPVLMHWRGSGEEPNRLARAYHSGASDDIGWFIQHLSERFPSHSLYAVGYSLGANALLKYLGETGNNSLLTGAMAVCPPLLLEQCANQLNQGFSRLYQRYLLKILRAQHEEKRQLYPLLNLPKADTSLDTFWKFDDKITAPLHGFDGATDYYQRCSARQFLPFITCPTHILSARDDPFFTPGILPCTSEIATNTTLEIAEKGGHVGFLNNGDRWLDTHVAETVRAFKQLNV